MEPHQHPEKIQGTKVRNEGRTSYCQTFLVEASMGDQSLLALKNP